MSADGKIADKERSPARFSSKRDRSHLEKQIALADAILFGASTLRAYGTTLRVSDPQLLHQRQQHGKPCQPLQIVCSNSGKLDPNFPFFQQQVPRWLLTTESGAKAWQEFPAFEKVLAISPDRIDWQEALQQLRDYGCQRLAVLGGGELVASLLAVDAIDEVWLTICPLILGGTNAPTPVGGQGFSELLAKRLTLIAAEAIDQEVFLHYRLERE